jgi:hypothetical protein
LKKSTGKITKKHTEGYMTLVRANAVDLLQVGLDEVLFEKYRELKPVYAQIFDIRSSDRQFEKTTGFSGFGSLVKKDEGSPITYDDPFLGYATMFTHLTYGLAFRVTMEMQQDDLYDVIRRMPSSLADTVVRFKDTQCANIFNNAFTTITTANLPWQTGMDGKTLSATDHPLSGGGTYSNRLATDSDLSVTSLETALYSMKLTVGDRNELLDLEPKVLLIPPQLERTAFELLKSSGRPDTANRADNWIPSNGLQMVVWNRLTDTNAWFLLTEKAHHNLIYFNRLELETDTDRDFNTKDTVYSCVSRFSLGWADWRGVYGTPGSS